MPFILSILASWGVPERFQRIVAYAGLALLACALVAAWMWQHDRKVIAEHEADIKAAVEEKTDKADAAATQAASTTKADVEETNANASEAARQSDDPLKAFLEGL